MNSNTCSDLDRIVSGWPGVSRRQEQTQIVFSAAGTNFCWLTPRTGMVQLRPPLGRNCVTRRLERLGNEVRVIRQKTGRIDAVYRDPGSKLTERFSYPSFMCSQTPPNEAIGLIRQAYQSSIGAKSPEGLGEHTLAASATTWGRGLATPAEGDRTNTGDLVNALDTVLSHKADRFINNPDYIAHVQHCVQILGLTDPRLAFIFGALDAMQQDFGSAAQMTRPPGSPFDVSFRANRLARLQRWLHKWKARNTLPFQQKQTPSSQTVSR